MLTAGSRGDVEPFVLLGRHAAAAGHAVRLGVPDSCGADLTGLDTVSLGVDFGHLVSIGGISRWTAARSFSSVVRPAMRRLLISSVAETVAFAPDLVVYHPKILVADATAARLGVPSVVVESVPSLTSTGAFPAPGIVGANLGPANKLTYAVAPLLAASMFDREIAEALALLSDVAAGQITSRRSRPWASLLPISPQLLSRPPDWPVDAHLTGAWISPASTTRKTAVDGRVAAFVAAGSFVYAGFGSMAAGDPEQRARAIITAARGFDLRVLVVTGWGGLSVARNLQGEDVVSVDAVPHEAVLPWAVLAIHHGGAGTVHAVARAGIPSVVVPFAADQPFWARQLHARRLAAKPVPYRRVTDVRLRDAISAAVNLRPQAENVGRLVRSERGLDAALAVLEQVVAG